MNVVELSKEEFAQLAKEIYYREIRPQVIEQHRGKFLVLDVESGDYEVDTDDAAALERMQARHPEGRHFLFRIGYRAAYSIGGGSALDE